MYIWFARKASFTGWVHKALMALVVLMMVSQLMSKPALAAPTDTLEQTTTPAQTQSQPKSDVPPPPPPPEENQQQTPPPSTGGNPNTPSGEQQDQEDSLH